MTVLALKSTEELAAPRRLRALPPVFLREEASRRYETFPGLSTNLSSDDVAPHLSSARAFVELHPSSAIAWIRLAQAELVEQHTEEAASAARAALVELGEGVDESTLFSASLVLAAAGEPTEAEAALARAGWKEGPSAVLAGALAAQRGDLEEARSRVANEDSPSAWNLQGWVALHTGDFKTAVRAYRRAVRLAGPTPETMTNLGLAHAALGHLDRAARETRQALALQPAQRERVVFNLATYLISDGDGDGAIDVVQDLMKAAPSPEVAFVEARLHLGLGEPKSALKVLRRARTTMWADLAPDTAAELDANLSFVRTQLGDLPRERLALDLLRALQSTEYESVRIASLLPYALTRFSDAEVFRRTLARVRERHGSDPLPHLEVHLALLERRFDDAVELAERWSSEVLLDPEPAAIAVYLLCDVSQNYERAVEIGGAALHRMPAAQRLSHNVSYALALLGQVDDARICLEGEPETAPYFATSALIALRSNDVDAAARTYRDAFELAKTSGDTSLPLLVQMHSRFAFHVFADEQDPIIEDSELDADEEWLDDLRVGIATEMLNRRGVDLPEPLQTLLQAS